MAVFDFGITDSEFWSMCPADWILLFWRWQEQRRWEDYLSSNIKAGMWELKRDREQRPIPFTARDFMVTIPPEDPRKRIGKRRGQK